MPQVPKAKVTEFPNVPEFYRGIADEFLQSWRSISENPDYRPSKPDRQRIVAQSRELAENHPPAGFIGWAMSEHIRRFEKQGIRVRYVSGPMALRYLLEEFMEHRGDPYQTPMNRAFFGLEEADADSLSQSEEA